MAEKTKVDYNPVTAQQVIGSTFAADVNDGKELAEEAGVVNPAHVDYVEALKNYESRSDVETLANRRARDNGTAFSDTDFVRTSKTEPVEVSEKDVENAEKSKSKAAKAVADKAEEVNPSE